MFLLTGMKVKVQDKYILKMSTHLSEIILAFGSIKLVKSHHNFPNCVNCWGKQKHSYAPSFFPERYLIGSIVERSCGAIVYHCRSQWNLTLDRSRVCCQVLNLILSSCSHWRGIKKGLWPLCCESFFCSQISSLLNGKSAVDL